VTDIDHTAVLVPVVELHQVSRTYGGLSPVAALKRNDLKIYRGQYMAVMGPSGSGKSTMLNILGLLDAPTEGEYLLDGMPTASLSESARADVRAFQVGFVFQSFQLLVYRTAVDNVELGLLYQHMKRKERRRRAIEVLEHVGLSHRMWATPPQLSGGERQRVAIARAIVRRPALILCDEPTGNLDSDTATQVLDLLDQLHQDGLTIVVITHDPSVAERAERIVTIRDGVLSEGVFVEAVT
jgi:putative ABC transport system ATP-binding protein